MRVQIQIPTPLWARLCEVAHQEHRFPKQQLEYLVQQTLTALREQKPAVDGHPPVRGTRRDDAE